MPRKKTPTRFQFSQVCDAATRTFGPDARRYISAMADQGMFPAVGRGGLVIYDQDHIRRIVIALELVHIATMSIAQIVRLSDADWKIYEGFCRDAETADYDVFLHRIRYASDPPKSVPKVEKLDRGELAKQFGAWLRGCSDAPQFASVNLSLHLRRMRDALAKSVPRTRGRPRKDAAKPGRASAEERL